MNLTPEQLETFKQQLTTQLEAFVNNGGIIVSKRFIDPNRPECKCPIEVFAPQHQNEDGSILFLEGRMTKACGFEFSSRDAWNFVYAFDGNKSEFPDELETFAGQLRDQYIQNEPEKEMFVNEAPETETTK